MEKEVWHGKYCYSCELDLTAENTTEFDGFDDGNYYSALSVGLNVSIDPFIKCDDCFNADIDRWIERQSEY
jgi:hypothetical protein